MSKALITFLVYPEGNAEPFQLDVDSRDVVLWEDISKSHRIKDLQDNQRFSDLYSLAHIAARRQQIFTGTLDEFKQSHALDLSDDDKDRGDEGEGSGADPTRPEA